MWDTFGTPLPSIDYQTGVPAPSLKGEGDNLYSEGIYTRAWFSADNLIGVVGSMINDAEGPTNGARCGLWLVEAHDDWSNDEDPFGGYWTANIHLNPWNNTTTLLGITDGSTYIERYEFEHDNQWHRWGVIAQSCG